MLIRGTCPTYSKIDEFTICCDCFQLSDMGTHLPNDLRVRKKVAKMVMALKICMTSNVQIAPGAVSMCNPGVSFVAS